MVKFKTLEIFNNLKLGYKLIIAYLLLGIFTVFSVAFVSYKSLEKAITDRTFDQLSSINILKKNQIEAYFSNRINILKSLAKSAETKNIFDHKISNQTYKSFINPVYKNYQFESILLLDTDLQPIFSTDSTLLNINELFSKQKLFVDFIQASKKAIEVKDFTGKISSKGHKTEVIIGLPVFDVNNNLIGLILALSNDTELTSLIYNRTGMGETGESYIVGADFKLRSKSRFFPYLIPYDINVNTIAAQTSLKGKSGVQIIKDYREVPVLSVFRPLNLKGLNWAIISEIDKSEALIPIYQLRWSIFIIGVIIVFIYITITTYISQKISDRIINLKSLLLTTSQGIIPTNIPDPVSMDEIGEMKMATRQLIKALEETADFAFEIGNGNFDKSYTPLSDKDVLGNSLIQMRDKLKVLTTNEIKLQKANSLKLIEGQEVERKRISRELHDGLGQLLTTIRFKLGNLTDNEATKSDIKNLLDDTIFEVRRISNNLMPSVLIDFGLKAALEKLINQIQNASGVKISLLYEKDTIVELPFDVITNIYRIVQEALNNMAKYAEATEAEVAIFETSEMLVVEIADNGKGFEINWLNDSYGLKNMKERVNILKGTFNIKSVKNHGTIIYCEIPLTN